MRRIPLFAGALLLAPLSLFATLQVRSGDRIAFMGDSITEYGTRNQDGYVKLVLRALKAEGVEVTPVFAGRSGHKSNDMLGRLERDVLSKKPQWMTFSCGVNDVWHQDWKKGVTLEDYKANVSQIFDRCDAANCKVVVLTATMFEKPELEKDPHNVKIAPYNAWLVQEAAKRKYALADLNATMWKQHAADPMTKFTKDGVHMNFSGDVMMARGVMGALGLDAAELASVEKRAWKPVWVLCRFDLKPETSRADYIARTKAVINAVRAEAGCREYRLLGDATTDWEKPQRFGERTLWMLEKWESETALKAHLEMPHMKAFGPTVRPMRSGSTFHVLEDVAP